MADSSVNILAREQEQFINEGRMNLFDTRLYRNLVLYNEQMKDDHVFSQLFYPHFDYGSYVMDFHETETSVERVIEEIDEKERAIRMKQLRSVSKTEKIIFPVMVATIVALILPDAAPLIGCLMLGNLMRECGVVERLSKTVQNELMNIVVIFLGLTVGATATAESFLQLKTLMILGMGIIAFGLGSAGGVLLAKFMNLFSKEKINPLIGSAGVSAVPMAARVSQQVGQESDPGNFLLMHAMGPNVAGVIGSAVAAGILLTMLG